MYMYTLQDFVTIFHKIHCVTEGLRGNEGETCADHSTI